MAILSMRARKKAWDATLVGLTATLVWLLQVTVLNNFAFQDVICNLPLTFTLLWGFVFGSALPQITAEELRTSTAGEVFIRQMLNGSVSGLLVGAFLAALYASVLPIYPISLPLVGWVAGYFSLRSLNQETLICLPIVLLGTVAAELVMATQLTLGGRPDSMAHLAQLALPEALLDALVAPFIYFPMRRWYDFTKSETVSS
jgi:rod shape-determining protein MreD